MVVGIGVDIVAIARMRQVLSGSDSMIKRVFTVDEIQYCTDRKNSFQHFAGRFAAKEAALKALGTGWQQGIRWRDVEVLAGEMGKPILKLYGKAREIFDRSGAKNPMVTITHAEEYAVAMVVLDS